MIPLVTRPAAIAARWFHALADETRLNILAQLKDGEKCVCELTEALQAGQSRLSFHLKTLKDAGIVIDRREGRWVYYTLNVTAIPELISFLTHMGDQPPVRRDHPTCCE